MANEIHTDIIMTARALLSLHLRRSTVSLCASPKHHRLFSFALSEHTSSNSIMQPKFTEGSDERQLMAETKNLLENEWTIDNEQVGFKKTYYFKNYTKAVVGVFLDIS